MTNGAEFRKLVVERERDHYVLRLYVTGMTARSTAAVAAVKEICEELLAGGYELSVVDLYQEPGRASEAQVIASPTLVKEAPEPRRRLIGDLTDRTRVARALGVRDSEGEHP